MLLEDEGRSRKRKGGITSEDIPKIPLAIPIDTAWLGAPDEVTTSSAPNGGASLAVEVACSYCVIVGRVSTLPRVPPPSPASTSEGAPGTCNTGGTAGSSTPDVCGSAVALVRVVVEKLVVSGLGGGATDVDTVVDVVDIVSDISVGGGGGSETTGGATSGGCSALGGCWAMGATGTTGRMVGGGASCVDVVVCIVVNAGGGGGWMTAVAVSWGGGGGSTTRVASSPESAESNESSSPLALSGPLGNDNPVSVSS